MNKWKATIWTNDDPELWWVKPQLHYASSLMNMAMNFQESAGHTMSIQQSYTVSIVTERIRTRQ